MGGLQGICRPASKLPSRSSVTVHSQGDSPIFAAIGTTPHRAKVVLAAKIGTVPVNGYAPQDPLNPLQSGRLETQITTPRWRSYVPNRHTHRNVARPGGRPFSADDRQGGAEDQDRQALFSRGLPRRDARSGLSNLGRFALGGRLPRSLDAGSVLQTPRRLSGNQLRPTVGNPKNPRSGQRRRGRRLRSRDLPAPVPLRSATDA